MTGVHLEQVNVIHASKTVALGSHFIEKLHLALFVAATQLSMSKVIKQPPFLTAHAQSIVWLIPFDREFRPNLSWDVLPISYLQLYQLFGGRHCRFNRLHMYRYIFLLD